ncbi:MAG: hypothetical protein OEX03_04125 [Gammaproteobacteria bacterium]|nr:hypothetical protein [Gammaproteobacteria bacterium]
MLLPGDTAINSVRVRGEVRNDIALRLSVSGFLEHADMRAKSMAPSALLIVRRIRDPMPGIVPEQSGRRLRHSGWEQALQNHLDDMARQASRPVLGRLNTDTSTEAVLFSDMAEMLACFVFDLSTSKATNCWWWQSLLRNYPFSQPVNETVANFLVEDIKLLPAVIARLHSWSRAKEVLLIFRSENVKDLIRRVSDAYALQTLLTDMSTQPEHIQPDSSETRAMLVAGDSASHVGPEAVDTKYIKGVGDSMDTIWTELLPNIQLPQGLPATHRFLLTLGLALQRSPWRCRDVTIQHAMAAAWHRDVIPASSENKTLVLRNHDTRASPETGGYLPRPDKHHLFSVQWNKQDQPVTIAPSEARKPSRKTVDKPYLKLLSPSELHSSDQQYTADNGLVQTSAGNRIEQYGEGEKSNAASELEVHTSLPTGETQQQAWSEEGLLTQWGGVLYLINVIEKLELPHCFEFIMPVIATLSPWAVLELLARVLLTDADKDVFDDPLWECLAQLDGRDGAMPITEHGAPIMQYRIPLTWIQQVLPSTADVAYASKGGRLRLWSEDQYLLADLPLLSEGKAGETARSLLAGLEDMAQQHLCRQAFDHAPVASLNPDMLNTNSPAIQFWLACVMPYIRFFLQKEFPDFGAEHLRCRGQLYLTDTHMDFNTAMDNISLVARRCGLDQNPGWLPDYGKVITFHFE